MKSKTMNTVNFREVPVCDNCHSKMEQKEADIKELNINDLSLLSMFRIHQVYIVECPACNRRGLQI